MSPIYSDECAARAAARRLLGGTVVERPRFGAHRDRQLIVGRFG